jgi:hypothetical protein
VYFSNGGATKSLMLNSVSDSVLGTSIMFFPYIKMVILNLKLTR